MKIRRNAKLNRDILSRPVRQQVIKFWEAWNEDIFDQVFKNADTIRRMVRSGEVSISKILPNRLTASDYEAIQKKLSIEYKRIYEKAGQFSLRKLGIEINFQLTDKHLRLTLDQRTETFPESSKVHYEDTMRTIEKHFINQGEAPYDKRFFSAIQNAVGDYTEAEAIRYARTESGVIAADAQNKTYKENGVEKKQWLTAFVNVRPSHLALRNKVVGIDEPFNVGGYPAMYPMDATLPAHELINCRCDIAPIFERNLKIKNVWKGQSV